MLPIVVQKKWETIYDTNEQFTLLFFFLEKGEAIYCQHIFL